VLEVIRNQELFDMHEQQTSKNARLIGYALGAMVAIAVARKFFAL
jgi:thioesterase domain-containing protein